MDSLSAEEQRIKNLIDQYEKRIVELEGNVAFWKGDAIAANTIIRTKDAELDHLRQVLNSSNIPALCQCPECCDIVKEFLCTKSQSI